VALGEGKDLTAGRSTKLVEMLTSLSACITASGRTSVPSGNETGTANVVSFWLSVVFGHSSCIFL
jgi:hypothetical protein